MFKKFFFLGLASGILSVLVSLFYDAIYFSKLADFSEAITLAKLGAFSFMISMAMCFVGFLISFLIKNQGIAGFLSNTILFALSFGVVFYVLKMPDPEFKNEDAQLFVDYYKGFLMPLIFFPALSWLTFKPLFIKA